MRLIAPGTSPSDRANREIAVTCADGVVSIHTGPPGDSDTGWTIVMRREDAHQLFVALATITDRYEPR